MVPSQQIEKQRMLFQMPGFRLFLEHSSQNQKSTSLHHEIEY